MADLTALARRSRDRRATGPLSDGETALLASVMQKLMRSDDYMSYRARILTVDSSVRITAEEAQAIDHAKSLVSHT